MCVTCLEADGDGLPLDGGGLGVADLVDQVDNLVGEIGLGPLANRVGNVAALDGNVEVLPEDAPVSLGHGGQLLVRPMPVVPTLLVLTTTQLAQTFPVQNEWGQSHGFIKCGKYLSNTIILYSIIIVTSTM